MDGNFKELKARTIFEKEGHRPVTVPLHGNKDIGNFAKRLLKEVGIN